jgi:hypothetical protein
VLIPWGSSADYGLEACERAVKRFQEEEDQLSMEEIPQAIGHSGACCKFFGFAFKVLGQKSALKSREMSE